MRTIKFRGKRVDNGEWVYGYYVFRPDGNHLIYWQPFEDATQNTYHEVIPETVGQFTGLLDKNGNEIYESDLISHNGRNGGEPHLVVFDIEKAAFCGSYGINYPLQSGELYANQIEITGNIHDK
jgi:uncharacterized phage protein (TIGR01671 family)